MDPIVLITQIHASGPEAAERLASAGLGDLAALSRATPKRVAKVLGVKERSARAIVQDALQALKTAGAALPSPPRRKKKAASAGSAQRRRTARTDGLTRQETQALLSEATAGPEPQEEKAPPADGEHGSAVNEKKVVEIPPGSPPRDRPESFWQFG